MLGRPAREWLRAIAPHLPLAGALLAALYFYWPGLRAPFLGDDYLLLLASRDESLGAFFRSASLPWADPGLLQLGDHYWRPLSFLTFRAMYAVFGAEPLPYHLLGLGFHLCAVVLVYAIAIQLTKSRPGAAVAAIVMALDPAGFESVAWAAAINSAALPLALGAWLAFLRATRAVERVDMRWLASSLVLEAAALAFRETAAVVTGAMLLSYLFSQPGPRLRSRTTWALIAAPTVLVLLDAIVLAGVFTPGRGKPLLGLDRDAIENAWFYLKQVVPALPADSGSRLAQLQRLAGVAMLVLPVAALLARRRLILVLSLAFLASILPYALFTLGYGPRYFYFPQAIFGLLCGAIVADAAARLPRERIARFVQPASVVAFALLLSLGAVVGRDRLNKWVAANPDVHERWIQQFQLENPSLPADAGVWAVDVPLPVSLLGGYIIEPTLAFEYPGGHHRIYIIDHDHVAFARSIMAPDDVIFEYQP